MKECSPVVGYSYVFAISVKRNQSRWVRDADLHCHDETNQCFFNAQVSLRVCFRAQCVVKG